MVSIGDIIDYVIARHGGVVVGHNWGEKGAILQSTEAVADEALRALIEEGVALARQKFNSRAE